LAAELLGVGVLALLTWLNRDTIGRTLAVLPRIDWRWLVAALVLELLSLMGFARTQRLILREAGIQVPATWMAATTFAGNAISVSLPFVGPGAGALFTFGRFERVTGDPARAGWALVVAGLVSSLVWAQMLPAAALLSGNATGLVVGIISESIIVVVTVAGLYVLHRPRLRQFTTKGVARLVERVLRLMRRPVGNTEQHIDRAIRELLTLSISVRRVAEATGFSLVNWLGSVGCLAAAILAVGAPVPWSRLLLVYVVGSAAGSFNVTPGGLGVVEGVLAAALVAAGLDSTAALGSVLIFRMVSFWLVALVGWVVFAAIGRHRPPERSR